MTIVKEPPPTLAELNKNIRHNMDGDPNWVATGEFHRDSVGNRFVIYTETVALKKRVPQRDADGKILYHLRADGSRHRPMMTEEVIGQETREFIQVPVGNGNTEKVYNFRETPEEIERRNAKMAKDMALADLAELPASALQRMVSVAREAVGLKPATKDQPDSPPEERDRYPHQFASGWWYLNHEHEVAVASGTEKGYQGSSKDAKREAQKLEDVKGGEA